MRLDGSSTINRAHVLRLLSHVLDENGGQVWAVSILLGVVNECRAATSSASASAVCIRRGDG